MVFKNYRFSLVIILVLGFLFSCKTQKQITSIKTPTISLVDSFAKQFIFDDTDLKSAHIGISIFNTSTQNFIYNYQANKFFVPASNTKIPTCYLAMKYLGDSITAFQYKKTDSNGVIIRPTADPTFLHAEYNSSRQINFLKSFNKIEIALPKYNIRNYGSGWAWNDFEETYMAPRSIFPAYGNVAVFEKVNTSIKGTPSYLLATTQINATQNEKGIIVKRLWNSNQFTVTDGKTATVEIPFITDINEAQKIIANETNIPVSISFDTTTKDWIKYYSQPTDTMLSVMMHRSDNYFAEQSLIMSGFEKNGIFGDAETIENALKTDFALMPHKPRWVDGSGLSRYNLFTPEDFVWLLNKIKNEFSWNRISTIFETGGEGTISSYYKKYEGKFFAKTGTLGNQVALSGYFFSKNNTMYIFSVLVNNHQTSATNVRKAVEKYLSAVIENY